MLSILWWMRVFIPYPKEGRNQVQLGWCSKYLEGNFKSNRIYVPIFYLLVYILQVFRKGENNMSTFEEYIPLGLLVLHDSNGCKWSSLVRKWCSQWNIGHRFRRWNPNFEKQAQSCFLPAINILLYFVSGSSSYILIGRCNISGSHMKQLQQHSKRVVTALRSEYSTIGFLKVL